MARVWAHVHVRHVAIVSRMAHRPNPGARLVSCREADHLRGRKRTPCRGRARLVSQLKDPHGLSGHVSQTPAAMSAATISSAAGDSLRQRRSAMRDEVPWVGQTMLQPQTTRGGFANELHWSKVRSPMWVTELGMVKFTKAVQLPKAKFPMWVTEFGMVKLSKELQYRKAASPMWVTESEMVKFTKAVQLAKA